MSSPAARPAGMQEVFSRDPFSLPSGIRIVSGESPDEAATPAETLRESRLTAILRRENRVMAAINHQVVQEGDVVNGEKVVQIGKDTVTLLAEDGSRRTLRLYENLPSIEITVPKEGK